MKPRPGVQSDITVEYIAVVDVESMLAVWMYLLDLAEQTKRQERDAKAA